MKMKKVIYVLLAVLMISALAACGSKSKSGNSDNGGKSGEEGGKSGDKDDDSPLKRALGGDVSGLVDEDGNVDVGGIIGGIMSGDGGLSGGDGALDFGSMDPALKQQIIDEARKEGTDIKENPDGSVTFTDEDGSIVTQNPDGTYTYEGEDGSQGSIGGDWPSNEFTKLVPKPSFTIFGTSTNDREFSCMFTDATVEDIREYTEKIKAKGFTKNVEEQDEDMMGITLFNYMGSNSDGYTVTITFAMGTSGLTITKE